MKRKPRPISNKLGTDKPIEIFIALFVILAVAMVLLKMFSSQVEQKSRELSEAQTEAKMEQARASLNQYCDARCSEATDENGILNYCKAFFPRELDLNGNKKYDDYSSEISLEGVCEDRIYCAQFKKCSGLTMQSCISRLCDFFEKNWGITGTDKLNERLATFIQPGACFDEITPEQKSLHWFTLMAPSCG